VLCTSTEDSNDDCPSGSRIGSGRQRSRCSVPVSPSRRH
jgi:hypothetical protein